MQFAVLLDFYLEPFGQGVYYRQTYTVQAAADFVSATAELSARVQFRQAQLNSRDAFLFVDTAGNSASVVSRSF